MGIAQEFAARILGAVAAHPYLQVILFILAFIVLAKIIDQICSRVIVRYLNKLDSETGNRIVALFHRPVFVTVILIGVLFALHRLELGSTTGYWRLTVSRQCWYLSGQFSPIDCSKYRCRLWLATIVASSLRTPARHLCLATVLRYYFSYIGNGRDAK